MTRERDRERDPWVHPALRCPCSEGDGPCADCDDREVRSAIAGVNLGDDRRPEKSE